MNIYVGNLSLDLTEQELRSEFTVFGEVESVVLMNDRYIGSGQTRGYGFVVMSSRSEGIVAIAGLQGKTLRSRMIDVVESLPLSDKRVREAPQERIESQFNRKARQRIY